MENHTNFPFGKDIFAKAFQEFDEEAFFQRLEDRVKPQSYFHKYKGFKDLISTLSYLFNIISAFRSLKAKRENLPTKTMSLHNMVLRHVI